MSQHSHLLQSNKVGLVHTSCSTRKYESETAIRKIHPQTIRTHQARKEIKVEALATRIETMLVGPYIWENVGKIMC